MRHDQCKVEFVRCLSAAGLLALTMAMSEIAAGETTIVNGANGADGQAASPGFGPTAGEDGGDATAIAISTDPDNVAKAKGGCGGEGGAVFFTSFDGGAGGTGGTGTANAKSHTSSSDASANAEATGGCGWAGGYSYGTIAQPKVGGRGGDGGTAVASAIAESESDGNIIVRASATGGEGGFSRTPGPGGNGGSVLLGPVYGSSVSGDVMVTGTAQGGGGRFGYDSVGAGATVILNNAVDGDTSGGLRLEQVARGGVAGVVYQGVAGVAGDAVSILSKTASARVLELISTATGGNNSDRVDFGTAGDGGSATAEASATNSGEAVSVSANATGGVGGRMHNSGNTFGSIGGASGRASATASARGTGMSTAVNANAYASASGGGEGGFGIGGRGADADATANGIAEGDGSLTVNAVAYGGSGGDGTTWLSGIGGASGTASAHATGTGMGSGAVIVTSEATGGFGGDGRGDGAGADGSTSASTAAGYSLGGGSVSVSAIQRAGHGGTVIAQFAGSNGHGGDSIAVDRVSGSTAGSLTLYQLAQSGGGFGGAGDAVSMLIATNPGGGGLIGTSETKVAGGIGSLNIPAIGGSARSTINLSGARDVTAFAIADSPDGPSIAEANAESIGSGLTAIADAVAVGKSGSVSANARSDSAETVVASTSAHVDGDGTSSSHALAVAAATGDNVLISAPSLNFATARAYGAPGIDGIMPLLTTNPAVGNDFDSGDKTTFFGISLLSETAPAAGIGAPTLLHMRSTYSIDTARIQDPQHLIVGFLDSWAAGGAFDRIDFRIQQEGVNVFERAYLDPAEAHLFFDDRTIDLGDWALGLSSDQILNIEFSLDVITSSPGDTFGISFLFGNSTLGAGIRPVPVSNNLWATCLMIGILSCLGRQGRRSRTQQ